MNGTTSAVQTAHAHSYMQEYTYTKTRKQSTDMSSLARVRTDNHPVKGTESKWWTGLVFLLTHTAV